MSAYASKAIYDALTAKGFDRDRSVPGLLRYVGVLAIRGRKVAVAAEFPCLDFGILPRVVLLDRDGDLPGEVAHIEDGNRLCYAAPGSVVLDRYQPGGAALTVLDLAERTLTAILAGEAQADVQREFPQHWRGSKLHVALPMTAVAGKAMLFTVARGKWEPLTMLARDLRPLAPFPEVERQAARAGCRPAYILRAKVLDLPCGTKPPETFSDLLDWAAACERGLEHRLMLAVQGFYGHIPSVFIMAQNGCIGVDLRLPSILAKSIQRASGYARVVDTWRARIPVRRWSGTPMDPDFMLNRNLAGQPSLAGRNVVLVGCGTIGGFLAKFLAQSGAGHNGSLLLVDPDVFSPGNVGRHLLGPGAVGLPKAEACRNELKRMFPDSLFRSVPHSILSCLGVLDHADLVVDATGEEAVSVALNDTLIHRRPKGPTAAFSWLVGAGAAAQAFLVQPDAPGYACLKCLYLGAHETRRHWPAPMGASDEDIAPACGEAAFTPYGVAAPAIAAGLVMKLCLDWAKGTPEPRLRTIRLDASATTHVEDCSPVAEAGCPACGRGTADAP